MQNRFTINLTGVIIDLMVIEEEKLPKYLQTLTFNEITRLNSIKHPSKKLEYAASRFLKHELFGNVEIEYLEHGSPFIALENTTQLISITHSHSLTGICKHEYFPVAIDLEYISDKSKKLAPKFCSKEESSHFDMLSSEEMTLLWSYKETLYKLSDRNGLIFKTDIVVFKENGKTFGKVKMKRGSLLVELQNIKLEDFYLTFNHTFKLLDASF